MEKRMLAAVGQVSLMRYYQSYFEEKGIAVAQILPLRSDFHDRKRYITIRDILERLLKNKVVPILNENDVLATADLCFSDNDNLAALTSVAIKADQLVFLTEREGIFDKDPRKYSDAKLFKEVREITPELKKACATGKSALGLGGMINKLLAVEMAMKACIEVEICRGGTKDSLMEAVHGKNPGTRFPAICSMSAGKFLGSKSWLAAGVVPTGTLIIDSGAHKALKAGKSLLAVGVKDVLGEFAAGDIVAIADEKRVPLGTGKVRFNSAILAGDRHSIKKPVIHANDMVVW